MSCAESLTVSSISYVLKSGMIAADNEGTACDHRIPLLQPKRRDCALHQRVEDLWRQVIERGNKMVRKLHHE